MSKPTPQFSLKASMVRKGLTLQAIAAKARVPYTRASEILNGHRNDPQRLRALRKVIEAAPTPAEVLA